MHRCNGIEQQRGKKQTLPIKPQPKHTEDKNETDHLHLLLSPTSSQGEQNTQCGQNCHGWGSIKMVESFTPSDMFTFLFKQAELIINVCWRSQ